MCFSCEVTAYCMDIDKQQMQYCVQGLLDPSNNHHGKGITQVSFSNNNSSNETVTESCNSYDFGNKTRIHDLLDRSWCYSYSQQQVVLDGCTTAECIKKCELEPLPAPPECARMVLL